ncbi:hypothetical protein B0O80DRAFT_440990 [Mortierella sp. GBAus27b]|nr:hypothetical protein B0O80DRAFT_440990 [Mortierella sp. GBAus27b]
MLFQSTYGSSRNVVFIFTLFRHLQCYHTCHIRWREWPCPGRFFPVFVIALSPAFSKQAIEFIAFSVSNTCCY